MLFHLCCLTYVISIVIWLMLFDLCYLTYVIWLKLCDLCNLTYVISLMLFHLCYDMSNWQFSTELIAIQVVASRAFRAFIALAEHDVAPLNSLLRLNQWGWVAVDLFQVYVDSLPLDSAVKVPDGRQLGNHLRLHRGRMRLFVWRTRKMRQRKMPVSCTNTNTKLKLPLPRALELPPALNTTMPLPLTLKWPQ